MQKALLDVPFYQIIPYNEDCGQQELLDGFRAELGHEDSYQAIPVFCGTGDYLSSKSFLRRKGGGWILLDWRPCGLYHPLQASEPDAARIRFQGRRGRRSSVLGATIAPCYAPRSGWTTRPAGIEQGRPSKAVCVGWL